ncbi:response regulator [Pseudomonas asuensis]|uniref:Response regulator n=2 Tax=Pseudomonas asuensis TaxID=1825787 RepID=A0ABQ2GYU6_9PSED|nr:response regulator [Pseudomonas asuensis]
MLVAEVIHDLGIDVIALPSADTGYMILEKHSDNIDLLISDIRMPGKMDGVDLANRVMSQWPHISIVLMSGYDGQALASLAKPTVFISKPWDIAALQQTLLTALSRPGFG